MHGITHLTGGSDPIPGLLPQAGSDYPAAVVGLGPYAYWRLGETGAPWLDTSGAGTVPADLTLETGAAALTANVAGMFPDDGAVRFNYGGTTPGGGDYIRYAGGGGGAKTFGHPEFTAVVWAKITAPNLLSRGVIMGNTIVAAFGGVLSGWALEVMPTSQVRFTVGMTDGFTERYAETPGGVSVGEWLFLVGTYTAADSMVRLYVNGELIAETLNPPAGLAGLGGIRFGWGGGDASHQDAFYNGVADEGGYWDRPLTLTEIRELYAAAASGGRPGDVLGLDENGNPIWVQPKVEVTVNGETPDLTTHPAPPPPPPPDDTGPDADDWIHDQPFLFDGSTFTVPPHKWTTIPFSTPLMERQSNVAGGSTTWFELDPDDPAAAGWVDPATPHVITIPHDMPFDIGNYCWMQVCLKLEIPPVEDEVFVEGTVTRGSHRGIRIFETTHQKAIVDAFDWRGECCHLGGALDVFRDETAHSLTSDGEWFAWGDTGGEHSGEHGNIMIIPNVGYGYGLPGLDWLPGHAEDPPNPTLKKGMRLVAQVWHNATVPIVCDCHGVYPYRPHFAFFTPALRSWGPPWSDWPLA